jgi:hypothetical protein
MTWFEIDLHVTTLACGKRANASLAGNKERTTDRDIADLQRCITSVNEAKLVNRAGF